MIRNVVFDLGGVLITWRPQEIIDAFYTNAALRAALREHVFDHADWFEMDRGTLDELALVPRFAGRMGRSESEMAALLDRVRDSLLPMPASIELATRLRARGLKLYALSNISPRMFGHLESRYDFFELFEGIVTSGAINLMKPDPQIYQHLVQRFAIAAAETVFIDDMPRNVESARRLGIAAIQFENVEQCSRELEALLSA
jgi:putative hydrolase of the HAD superfamily